MLSKNALMACFFIATIGVMLIISGMIFVIYCFIYEVKNKKKLYKESKRWAVAAIILGIIMLVGSLLFLNVK